MRTNNIRQVVTIKAGPRSVYEALMDSRKHAKFTGGQRVHQPEGRGPDQSLRRLYRRHQYRARSRQKDRPGLAGKRLARRLLFQGDFHPDQNRAWNPVDVHPSRRPRGAL